MYTEGLEVLGTTLTERIKLPKALLLPDLVPKNSSWSETNIFLVS